MKRHSKRSIYSILICLSLLFPPETHCAYMLAFKTAGKYVANFFLKKGGQEVAKKAAPAAAGVAAAYFLKPSQTSSAPTKATTAPAAAPMKTNAASSVQANSKLDSPTFKKTLSKTLPAATQTKVEPKSGTQALSQDKAATLSTKTADKLHNTKVLKAAAEKALTINHKTADATLSTGQSQSNSAKLDTAPKARDFNGDVGIKADGLQKNAGDLSQADRIKPGSPTTTGSLKKRGAIQLNEQRNDVLRLFEKAKRNGDPAAVDEWKSAFTSFKETYGIEAHSYSEPKVIGVGDPNKPYQVFENQYPDLPARPAVPTKPSPEPDLSKIKPNDLPPKPNVPVAPPKPDTPKQSIPIKRQETPNGIPHYVRPTTYTPTIIGPRQLIDLLENQAHTDQEEGNPFRKREEERIEQSDKRRDRIKIFVEGPIQFNLEKQGSHEKPDLSDKVTPQQDGDNQPKKPDDEEKNNNVAKAAAGEALGLDALKKLKNKSNASGSKSNSNGNASTQGSTRAGSNTDDSLKKLKTDGQTQATDNSKIQPAKVDSNRTAITVKQTVHQGSEAILTNGFYEVNGFKFTERYYNRLWETGRKGPSLIAKEILNDATSIIPDKKLEGFFKYICNKWEMVYNPTTKQIVHLAPISKNGLT